MEEFGVVAGAGGPGRLAGWQRLLAIITAPLLVLRPTSHVPRLPLVCVCELELPLFSP